MKKILAILLVSAVFLSVAGCTNTPITTPIIKTTPVGTPVSFNVVKGDAPRVTSPNVTDNQLSTLVNGNSDFAFNLYQILKNNNTGNLFYSPYSISTALAMTYAGAVGDTEKQMSNALHFTLPQAQLHPAFNQLSIDLASRGQNAKGTDGKSFSLNIANALWGQKDYTIQPAFLNLLAQNYGAGMNMLDFIKSPEDSHVTINNWVSDQTNNRIKDLIPQGAIDQNTRFVLTNAIYFDAAWQDPFAKESTRDNTFNLLNGKTVSVPMMNREGGYSYLKGTGYQAIELPYSGNEVAMDIIMPDAGKFTNFESAMTAEKVNGIIGSLKNGFMTLTMPKFQFDSSFNLNDALTALGMPIAFTDKADFSGITGKPELYISDVVHKAFVAVDEEGTEAAAASGVIMAGAAMPQNSLTIDQPFIFLIRDIKTGAILFVGRVLNPAL
jgi:serpin B